MHTNIYFKHNFPQLLRENISPGFLLDDIKDNSRGARHLLFATKEQLDLLSKAVDVYMDGTFRVVKKPFAQLFTIHAFVKAGTCYKQVPLLFALMSARSKWDYKKVNFKISEMNFSK